MNREIFWTTKFKKDYKPAIMKLPSAKPVAIGGMTKEQIDIELQKGMDDIAAGRVVSADEVEAEMRRLYGI